MVTGMSNRERNVHAVMSFTAIAERKHQHDSPKRQILHLIIRKVMELTQSFLSSKTLFPLHQVNGLDFSAKITCL